LTYCVSRGPIWARVPLLIHQFLTVATNLTGKHGPTGFITHQRPSAPVTT